MKKIQKVKTVAKYIVDILSMINALLIAIDRVEGISIPYITQISGVIIAICGVAGTYLLGNKAVKEVKEKIETL